MSDHIFSHVRCRKLTINFGIISDIFLQVTMFWVLALQLIIFQLVITLPLQEELLLNLTNFGIQDDIDTDLSAHPNLKFEKKENIIKSNILKDATLSLIVNGQLAVRGQFPYQVALISMINLESGHLTCGGSLISSRYVLTAAHCLYGGTASTRWLAVIGGVDLTKKYEEGRRVLPFTTSNVKIHEKYNNVTYINDIALIQLPITIQTSAYIKKVELPTREEARSLSTFVGNSVVVSGWGRTKDISQATTPYLQYGYMTVLDQGVCTQKFSSISYALTNGQICASVGSSRTNICNGDSGGPLVIQSFNSRPVQVGIVSLGVGKCEQGLPSIYTRTASYLDWIGSNSDVKIY